MTRITTALAAILSLASIPLCAQDLQKGLDAYEVGDYTNAIKEWRPLADQGDVQAQYHLGQMYKYGKGVPQGYADAVKWYGLAAEQGNVLSQLSLGRFYQFGEGVIQDNVMAHMWYNLAAAGGSRWGITSRDKIAKEMTSEDISKAQGMASECMISGYKKCGD